MTGHSCLCAAMQCGHAGCMTEAVLYLFQTIMAYITIGEIDPGLISKLLREFMNTLLCICLDAICDEHRKYLRLIRTPYIHDDFCNVSRANDVYVVTGKNAKNS
jgi:hypothetical protein